MRRVVVFHAKSDKRFCSAPHREGAATLHLHAIHAQVVTLSSGEQETSANITDDLNMLRLQTCKGTPSVATYVRAHRDRLAITMRMLSAPLDLLPTTKISCL